MSKVNVAKSEPSFIPTPSPIATPNRVGAPSANQVGAPSANLKDAPSANLKDAPSVNRVGAPSASRVGPTPSSKADPPQNKTNIKVKTTTRINRTDILKNPEPAPKAKIISHDRQATNYLEICIIMIIVYIIYRCCIKKPVKKNPRFEGLPIHTPPTSPDNKRNQEVYYGFHQNTPSVYRRTNSSISLT
jgi:hypothetical protein